MGLEADLLAAEREGRRAWKQRDDLAQQLANDRFGYALPQTYRIVDDGVVYELNVYASLRKVGRDDDPE
jgi:hypothetical protein